MPKLIFLPICLLLAGISTAPVLAQSACTATTSATIADKIANGHSWPSHSAEYPAGTVMAGLAMPASPVVNSIATFKSHVITAMGSATNKALSNGRKAWWYAATGTFVVHDPSNVDCGTAFRPIDGKAYYDKQT